MIPFLSLTQEGKAVRRDYILWHRELSVKFPLPDVMRAVAEARL